MVRINYKASQIEGPLSAGCIFQRATNCKHEALACLRARFHVANLSTLIQGSRLITGKRSLVIHLALECLAMPEQVPKPRRLHIKQD